MLSYPKGETVWVRYVDQKQSERFILTSKTVSRDCYFLYEIIGDSFKRLGKAGSPVELEEKYHVLERLQEV